MTDEEEERHAHCPQVSSCEMFKILKFAGTLKVWKIRYCEADYHQCARHKLASLGNRVPINLMPNGSKLNLPK